MGADIHICSRASQPQRQSKKKGPKNEKTTCACIEETVQEGRLRCNIKQKKTEEGFVLQF